MPLRIACLLVVAFPALASAAAFAAPCPESCLDSSCSSAASRDSTVDFTCAPFPPVQGRMSYDLVVGRLYAEARGCSGWDGPGGGSASVDARDRYRLVGPAGGGAVSFEARLQLAGGVGGFAGTCGGSILEVGGASASAHDGGAMVLNTVIGIPLTHLVGDEFEVHCFASGSAGGSGSIGFVEALLSFAGLPAGYGVTSCQGFAGDGAVAARTASWGALKLRYD